MTNGWDGLIRDGNRAKGELREYLYEIRVPADADADGEGNLHGTVLLRLVAEPARLWPTASDAENGRRRAETSWKFLVRTHCLSESAGEVISEPFFGGLPYAVSGVGPFDDAPEEEFDPDVLTARLLAHVSDWRNPEEQLTPDQMEWFQRLGPGVKALLPADEARATQWVRDHRLKDGSDS